MQASENVKGVTSDEWQALHRRPAVAWPTLGLFALSVTVWSASFTAGVQGLLPIPVCILLSGVAAFWFFSVFHEASHNSVSSSRLVNEVLGRISIMAFAPAPLFRAFRFVHMQHHRFANDATGKDPDRWAGEGPFWLLPVRWVMMDGWYFLWYLRRLPERSRGEVIEMLWSIAAGAVFFGVLLWQGWAEWLFWLWFLPGRLACMLLACVFDYIPHWPYAATHAENPYQATGVRLGQEWLLTPLLVYQNYHLIHHLYPLVPFYRYRRVWEARKAFFLGQGPLLLTLGGREVFPEGYARPASVTLTRAPAAMR